MEDTLDKGYVLLFTGNAFFSMLLLCSLAVVICTEHIKKTGCLLEIKTRHTRRAAHACIRCVYLPCGGYQYMLHLLWLRTHCALCVRLHYGVYVRGVFNI